MRTTVNVTVLIGLMFVFGCKRGSSILVITELGNGWRYERWNDVSDSPRVLVTGGVSGASSSDVIIPGDIVSCQKRGRYIFGEKAPSVRPAAWTSLDWDRSGFFLVDTSAIDLSAFSDEERCRNAVKWFESMEYLEQALKSSR